MLIILSVLILFVLGIVVFKKSLNFDGVGLFLMVAGGVLLFICLIAFPVVHLDTMNFIAEIHSVQESFNEARGSGTDLENATILKTVMKANWLLASRKYYNTTIFDIWIPDAIMEVCSVK